MPNLEALIAKYGIILAVVFLVVLLVAGWLWWNNHENAKNAAAVPQAQAKVNAAQASAGGAAVNTIANNTQKNDDTDKKTQQVTNVYNSYPQAKAPLDPGFVDAFNHGICLYKSAANLPECVRLLNPDTK